MKAIIIGSGQIGYSTAFALVRDGVDVTVIDHDTNQLTKVRERIDVQTVLGNGATPSVLSRAGADDADVVIAVSNNDEVNLLACHICHVLFRTPTKLAYLRNPDYVAHPDLFEGKASLAVDAIISPERVITARVRRVIQHQGAGEVIDLADGEIRLVIEKVSADAPLAGKKLGDALEALGRERSEIVAIYRKRTPMPLTDDYVLSADDDVYVAASRNDIFDVLALLNSEVSRRNRKIIIAGAGSVGLALAKVLESRNYQVKLIEFKKSVAKAAADELLDTVVLHGDAIDEDLLRQEYIDECDVYCALTNKDEVNVLSAFVAKRLGAKKTIALVNRQIYAELLHEEGNVDVVISPAESMVGSIVKYVRRIDVSALHSLRGGLAEVIEVIVHGDAEHSKVVGKSVAKIALPEAVRVVAVVRGDQTFFEFDTVVIEAEDRLILFAQDRSQVAKIERLFQVSVGFI